MKKYDEGYSLPLVLVVMAVLAALASGLMTLVMRNMEAQQSSVVTMQNQYEAQGKLEMVIAELCQFSLADVNQSGTTTSEVVIENKVDEICEQYDVTLTLGEYILGDPDSPDITTETHFSKEFSSNFTLSAVSSNVKVTYEVTYSGIVAQSVNLGRGYYLITAPEVTYHSYAAELVTGGNGT